MLTAVSCLSPVNTQIFIPASWRDAIVSGTPSCRRSSIPVAPGQNRKTRDNFLFLGNQLAVFLFKKNSLLSNHSAELIEI